MPAWGADFDGMLGNGTTIDSLAPAPVLSPDDSGPLTGVTSIAAGRWHSLAIGRVPDHSRPRSPAAAFLTSTSAGQ
ncbi:RCC1 domain-containing protein [Amycolatopsis sp. FDAARGOS 1241]|uniref:RCC1 domain-containing protein n=1 Tax=Amycolatopsis sp. FDAARGOS 1241 TaxID=2778070 RepID=UPI0019519D77|nr:RCC1 domain-containing protein [Amycolatopsis sp. FDAARGOS 1241]QRP50413.1 hypothetical protein I6J71_23610 [Amycolatopsis sp. FDAARGOS 1241]